MAGLEVACKSQTLFFSGPQELLSACVRMGLLSALSPQITFVLTVGGILPSLCDLEGE